MAKNWQRVDPEGKAALKQLDDVQRNLRERGKQRLPEEVTGKMIGRLVKQADPKDMEPKGGKK